MLFQAVNGHCKEIIMKTILKILPDALSVVGCVCIVVALWLVSPVLGLGSLGIVFIIYALLLAKFGGANH